MKNFTSAEIKRNISSTFRKAASELKRKSAKIDPSKFNRWKIAVRLTENIFESIDYDKLQVAYEDTLFNIEETYKKAYGTSVQDDIKLLSDDLPDKSMYEISCLNKEREELVGMYVRVLRYQPYMEGFRTGVDVSLSLYRAVLDSRKKVENLINFSSSKMGTILNEVANFVDESKDKKLSKKDFLQDLLDDTRPIGSTLKAAPEED